MSTKNTATTGRDCQACAAPAAVTPLAISNRPALPAVGYRIGDYLTFRQAMLERIHREAALRTWTARRDDDFGIALIDMWAYIADILAFYQERIANEAYLRTALQRESLRRLAALIDYRPAQGVAAAVYLAFLLQQPTPAVPEVRLNPGLKTQSVPGPEEKPQKFETGEARLARFVWNKLQPKRFEPQPFDQTTVAIYLKGRITSIKPGDYVLLVGDERRLHPDDQHLNECWDVRPVDTVEFVGEQTRVSWTEPLGSASHKTQPAGNPTCYILRRRASLFGFNAPPKAPRPAKVVSESSTVSGKTTTTTTITYDDTVTDWDFQRVHGDAAEIDLDAEYPKIVAGEWVVLMQPTWMELYAVKEVTTEHRAKYSLSGKVTHLALDTKENLDKFYTTNLRKTVVLFGGEEFKLGETPINLKLPDQDLEVLGDHRDLEKGRPLIFRGFAAGEAVSEVAFSEVAFVERVTPNGVTSTIHLRDALRHSYARDTVEIYANALYATHGETVSEVLGNGDAAQAFQSFTLKKKPVTFVPDAGTPTGAANTLAVRVDGLLWQESRSFYGHGAGDAVHTTRSDGLGEMLVTFGDGLAGRRLPTGRNNVTAIYRQGIGRAGNVRAETITTLLGKPPGVKGVLNPMAAEGGAEPEREDDIRANAPNTVRTFGRIISLRDFEDAAREHAGIAKARAAITWNGEDQLVELTVAGDHGDPVPGDGVLYKALLDDLNQQRDPNRKFRLVSYQKVPVLLDAVLFVNTPTYVLEDVLAAARAAIIAFFDFDHLSLGQTVHLNDVITALQNVPGVVALDVNRFLFKPPVGLTNSKRRDFFKERRRFGAPPQAVLQGDGMPAPGDDIQSFAGTRPGELIVLADPATDLNLTALDNRRPQP